MNVNVQVDSRVARDALQNDQKQAPFALSLAINNTTKDAQKAIQEGYAQRFTLRRPDFIKREGAKITKFSKKNDQEAIIQVTEKAGFLVKFEDGGEKTPKDGKAIAIPLAARRNKNDIIPTSARPPALYRGKGGQSGRIFSAGGRLWQAFGRGRNAVVKALYAWRTSVRVRPMLQFEKTANAAVDKHWRTRALEAVDKALQTKR